LEVLLDVDSNLVIVTHRKLASGKTGVGSILGVLEGQLFILCKDILISKQEPSTHAQRGLRRPLAGGKAVVMERICWVEIASELAELVCLAHFELRFSEAKIRSFLNVLPSNGLVKRQNPLGDVDVGEFSGDKHTVHEGALGCILVWCVGGLLDHVESLKNVLLETVLPHEVNHAQPIVGCRITQADTNLVMLECVRNVVGVLVEHAHPVFSPTVPVVGRLFKVGICLALVLSLAKLAKLEPLSFHKACLGMVLAGEIIQNVDCVDPQLMFNLGRRRALPSASLSFPISCCHILRSLYPDECVPGPYDLHWHIVRVEDWVARLPQDLFFFFVARRDVLPFDFGERREGWHVHHCGASTAGMKRFKGIGLSAVAPTLVGMQGRSLFGSARFVFQALEVVLHILGDFWHHPAEESISSVSYQAPADRPMRCAEPYRAGRIHWRSA
jgi:hypothetical protein